VVLIVQGRGIVWKEKSLWQRRIFGAEEKKIYLWR
jgi:hypothetical protein